MIPWTILNTQTGSSTTNVGPSQGTTGSGTNYIYTEASGNTQPYGVGIATGDINYLESNGTLDASLYSFTLSYYYNMNFNSDTTGTHTVQVWNGSGWVSVAGSAFGTGWPAPKKADLFIIKGIPDYIRSDNGPEFTAVILTGSG